jgi:hypothetical protein
MLRAAAVDPQAANDLSSDAPVVEDGGGKGDVIQRGAGVQAEHDPVAYLERPGWIGAGTPRGEVDRAVQLINSLTQDLGPVHVGWVGAERALDRLRADGVTQRGVRLRDRSPVVQFAAVRARPFGEEERFVTAGQCGRAHRRLGLAMQDEGEYTAGAGLAQERPGHGDRPRRARGVVEQQDRGRRNLRVRRNG